MPAPVRRKDEVIQIRASAEAKAVLNRAAALRGQKLSEFMLDSARRQAEETILDQRTFFLDDKAHARFVALLDAPPKPSAKAHARFSRKGAVGDIDGGAPALRAPEPLAARHDVSRFTNGLHPSLDRWQRERARPSEGLSARTYVACPVRQPDRVVGYLSISTAVEQRNALPSAKLRRGMLEQVPLLLIGRLAVDVEWQGRGLGSALLVEALKRCMAASEIAGVRAVIAHAIDDEAVTFYERHGFVHSPFGERVMLMPIETVRSMTT